MSDRSHTSATCICITKQQRSKFVIDVALDILIISMCIYLQHVQPHSTSILFSHQHVSLHFPNFSCSVGKVENFNRYANIACLLSSTPRAPSCSCFRLFRLYGVGFPRPPMLVLLHKRDDAARPDFFKTAVVTVVAMFASVHNPHQSSNLCHSYTGCQQQLSRHRSPGNAFIFWKSLSLPISEMCSKRSNKIP